MEKDRVLPQDMCNGTQIATHNHVIVGNGAVIITCQWTRSQTRWSCAICVSQWHAIGRENG